MTQKSHRIIIGIEAETDITNAAMWYENRQRGLGEDFIADIESAISSAAANPFRYPCLRRQPEVRRVLTERFPYRVFFIRQADAILVFRVLHGARHDREWKQNAPQ